MNVVVVGAGIVGLASAYALAERGADVVVCEKGSVGGGSTERSAGGIRTQFSTPVNVRLSQQSIEVWESFKERFGVDIAYRRSGYLFLARTDETAAEFQANVEMQQDLGVDSRLLSPEAAREHCPSLDPSGFQAATYCPTDGFVDPHLALQGYAAALGVADVDVRTNTAVVGIERQNGRVTAVETNAGSIDTDFVVNAAGPWAAKINELVDVSLPVEPRRRQVAVVSPEASVPESVPLTIDLDVGSYFRPERDGDALVGGHFDEEPAPTAAGSVGGRAPAVDPDRYSTTADQDWLLEAVERAADYASYFGPQTRIKRGWAGLYAVTPDHHPIVDEVVPGFVAAIGFSGHGFQHAPATGDVVADIVFDGEPASIDGSALSADRFEAGDTHTERNVA